MLAEAFDKFNDMIIKEQEFIKTTETTVSEDANL